MSISSDVIFGTLNSRTDLGLIFTHKVLTPPEVHTEYIEIPGREPLDLSQLGGAYPLYNNRELTVEFEHPGPDFQAARALVFEKLHGRKMQIRFLDDPNWYYTGRLFVAYEVTGSTLHFTITITAEPFKRMVSETVTTLNAAGTITNPTDFPAYPLIRVYGSGAGTVTVNNKTVTISTISTYIDIDSEVMDCYKGTANLNNQVSLASFPVLNPGSNGMSFSGAITKLEITGRWRSL